MSDQQWTRLKEEQELAVDQTQSRIQSLSKFKTDYISLQKQLLSLPNKLTHTVMVPFGKKAFMPGQLIHTNEILVLLGDNWFADRSAHQASEIVDRRVAVLDKQISELKQQLHLLTPRLEFTSELKNLAQNNSDLVEITEEYDPEKERIWKERHKESVRKHNKEQRDEHQEMMLQEKLQEEARLMHEKEMEAVAERELWARLDELELEEQTRGELDKLESSESNDESSSGSSDDTNDDTVGRRVRWRDKSSRDTTSSNVITFKHTPTIPQEASTCSDTERLAGQAATNTGTIDTPADIYKQYTQKHKRGETKSILKSSVLPHKPDERGDESTTKPQPPLVQQDAFSSKVMEKSPSQFNTPASVASESNKTSEPEASGSAVPKKVSRFKAQRMQSKP